MELAATATHVSSAYTVLGEAPPLRKNHDSKGSGILLLTYDFQTK